MSPDLVVVFDQILRILYLGIAPIIIIVVLAAILSSVIQSTLAIKNESFDFALKLLAFLLALYFFLPGLISAIIELYRYCYNA